MHPGRRLQPGQVCCRWVRRSRQRSGWEVIPNQRATGQDFLVQELRPQHNNIAIQGPQSIQGAARKDNMAYEQSIHLRVSGKSAIIPGITRHFEATVTPQKESGFYSMHVAAGTYSIVATPADSAIPPLVQVGRTIEPGAVATVDLLMPSQASLRYIEGRLVKLAEAKMEIQVVDAAGEQALSQRSTVAPDGSFRLTHLPPPSGEIAIVAAPADSTAMVPTKTFQIATSTKALVLELGEYGVAVAASGRL